MRPTHTSHPSKNSFRFGLSALIVPLLTAALACNFLSTGDTTLRETDIALGIQQTLVAQTATAMQNPSGPTATTAAPSTSQPEATPTVEATTAVPAATDTAAPPSDTPTSPPSVSLDPVVINEFGLSYWLPLSSGCKVKDAGCWRMNDDYKIHLGAGELAMVSKQPVAIDASWPRPYLVFWHKYDFASTARIDIQGNSTWSTLLNLNEQSSRNSWVQGAINLDMFKGKQIIVRFIAQGIWGSGGIPGSDWYVNDVRVIPNYQP